MYSKINEAVFLKIWFTSIYQEVYLIRTLMGLIMNGFYSLLSFSFALKSA
ncbi:hypothetical protein DRF65_15630 [Chryseobacterium pennae]|uniref:Uncharacterized protein n=1 Tax=Chryseobacterium pennae TaxID=2258962 RepID=A0A3D9C6Y9_9FLAO|nr:hypothetical protein DRF65_15630 [Chryseobacterium pennae]